jgi:hypothetical protein
MIARVFNDEGVDVFREQIAAIKGETLERLPPSLLTDPRYSSEFQPRLELPALAADTTRFRWAQVIVAHLGADEVATELRKGFWTWLSAFYFDVVCPVRSDGTRRIGQEARYIPSLTDYRTYYRHLLMGPWSVYGAHLAAPEFTKVVLAGPLSTPGEVAEQIASRQELITIPSVLESAYVLYFDQATQRLRARSGTKGPGGPRRLVDVLNQFDLTFDFFTLEASRLVSLLPREFRAFAPA